MRRKFDLNAVPRGEAGLSPLETWCNEAQERYVLAIAPEDLQALKRSASASAVRLPWWDTAEKRAAPDAER